MQLSYAQAMREEALSLLACWAQPGPQTGWQGAGRHWEMGRRCSEEMTQMGWLPAVFAEHHLLTLICYPQVGLNWSVVWENMEVTNKLGRTYKRLIQGNSALLLEIRCFQYPDEPIAELEIHSKRLNHIMAVVEKDPFRSSNLPCSSRVT